MNIQIASVVLIGTIIGILMVYWFNYSIHQEMRRRLNRETSVLPISIATEVNDVPVGTVVIVVNQ